MNIVTENDWTSTTGALKDEDAPRIRAHGYRINNNSIVRTVQSWQAAIKTSGADYYKELYKDAEREATAVLPFYTDNVRSTSSTWGDNYVGSTNGTQAYGSNVLSEAKTAAEQAMQTAGELKNLINNQPGSLFEPPKYFNYSVDEGPVVAEFVLINTNTEGAWKKNQGDIRQLIEWTRFKREGVSTVIPPLLWRVAVPGFRSMSWASMNIDVNLVGMRRMLEGEIVPEGYNVRATFTPIHTETVDLMKDTTQPYT